MRLRKEKCVGEVNELAWLGSVSLLMILCYITSRFCESVLYFDE